MPNKKLSKAIYGIPKTPIDDNTLLSVSMDNSYFPEVSSLYGSLPTMTYTEMPTGLGFRNSAGNGSPNYNIQNFSDFTIDFWIKIDLNISTANHGAILSSNNSGSYLNLWYQPSNKTLCMDVNSTGVVSAILTKNLNHIRVTFNYNADTMKLYINGILVSTNITSNLKSLNAVFTSFNVTTTSIGILGISDLSISNIDRGNYFPTLPQDFIDGKAVIKPTFTNQRQVYSDALYSETKTDIVKIGSNLKQITNSRTTGSWTSADTIKVKGLAGEIVSGVIDTDTALAKIISVIDGSNIIVSSIANLNVGDGFIVYQVDAVTGQINISTGASGTITAINTSTNQLTTSLSGFGSAYVNGYLFETTASSSSPTVKANLTGTATAGASNTVTLPSTFSATDDLYNNYDIYIVSGTGAGQRRTISDYVGSTKVATVSQNWTTNPDATSVFVIYRVNVAGTWTNLGTNEATFTLGTNSGALTNQDLEIQYSLNEVQGQGQTELFTKTLGGEVNGKKLISGTVAVRDDFVGKIIGNIIECPHTVKWSNGSSTALNPTSGSWGELNNNSYKYINSLNGSVEGNPSNTAGNIPQNLFSFNLIRAIEDKYGEIPSLDKVKWLKDNISKITCNWYGYGVTPIENKAKFTELKIINDVPQWDSYYSTNGINTSSSVALVNRGYNAGAGVTPSIMIQSDGFIHFLAYTDPARTTDNTLLYLTAHGLGLYDVFENVTRNGLSVITTVQTNYVVGNSSISGQVAGDTIKTYKSNGVKVAEAGSNDTTLIITNHGLSTGDVIKSPKYYSNSPFKITVVDANTITTPTITGQCAGDSLQTYKYNSTATAENGVAPSTIYTDYVSLDVELKTTTGYDVLVPENPRRDSKFSIKSSDMSVTGDFYGKTSGDVNRVPHVSKWDIYNSSLLAPSGSFASEALGSFSYDKFSNFDGTLGNVGTSTSGKISQKLFSFNLIRLVEDKYGTIPSVDKVAWLKNNINQITCNWCGYGSCPSGNKAYLDYYSFGATAWNLKNAGVQDSFSNTSIYPKTISLPLSGVGAISWVIDSNGFIHYLAYTDASDGVTASTIYTDYINLQVTLKDSALIQLPYLKSKLGNENILQVRKETKEVQTYFPSKVDSVVVYGEYNKTSAIKGSASGLANGYVVSNMKTFLTSLTTKIATGAVYNTATKFDFLDDFSIIDNTVSSSLTNGLNLYINSNYNNLISSILDTKTVGWNLNYKNVKVGKIYSISDKLLQIDDPTGSVLMYLDLSMINNTLVNYVPVMACIVKNSAGELQLLVAVANNSQKRMALCDQDGRILIYPLPNRPLVKN